MLARSRFCLSLIALLVAVPAFAQQACQPPPISLPPRPPGILSVEQEHAVGEARAAHLERYYMVIEDDPVADHLRTIGARLSQHVPDPAYRFTFNLVDIPIINAFTLPGGRIYVTRKLVAFTRTEDELAGVLAHEIGHNVTYEMGEWFSLLFKKVLKVTEFGDRDTVMELYHELIENSRRSSGPSPARDREQGQQDADSVAIYLMLQAGFAPQAYVNFWDRLADAKGKTGNWFTDLFGTTSPASRRLREMIKTGRGLPAGCMQAPPANPTPEYDAWRKQVIAYSGLGRLERLPGRLSSATLEPPLQSDMHTLRFSPDGKLLLAQNDASIYVLTTKPLQTLFRIEAPEAYAAQFTPDSQAVVFHNAGLRVETWSVAEQQRTEVAELLIREGCYQTELSADGKTLACFTRGFDLLLVDVASGENILHRKTFLVPDFFQLLRAIRTGSDSQLNLITMGFSPEARFFAASGSHAIAFDLSSRKPVPLSGSLKRMLEHSFTFVDSNRIFGIRGGKGEKSAMVHFPSGNLIKEIFVGAARPTASADGKHLLIRPVADYPVGVVDLEKGEIFAAHDKPAMDIYDDLYVKEARRGDLALYNKEGGKLTASTTVPRGVLGSLRAAALSDDGQWLALSERGRGAVWNLKNGRRYYYTRGFRGAYFDSTEQAFYADYPEHEKEKRMIARLDLRENAVEPRVELDEIEASQFGPLLLVRKPKKEDELDKNVTFEMREASTDKVLWSEHFARETPRYFVNWRLGTMALLWSATDGTAREEIRQDAALTERARALREQEGDYYIRVVDVRSGQTLGRLLVETGKGSFRLSTLQVHGQDVVAADATNRVLIYSLATGELRARAFGRRPVVSAKGGWLALEEGRGKLAVFELATMTRKAEFSFPREISMVQFGADGARLHVLTDNQTLYSVDLTAAQKETVTAGPGTR
jgi:WD40 repeat protein